MYVKPLHGDTQIHLSFIYIYVQANVMSVTMQFIISIRHEFMGTGKLFVCCWQCGNFFVYIYVFSFDANEFTCKLKGNNLLVEKVISGHRNSCRTFHFFTIASSHYCLADGATIFL